MERRKQTKNLELKCELLGPLIKIYTGNSVRRKGWNWSFQPTAWTGLEERSLPLAPGSSLPGLTPRPRLSSLRNTYIVDAKIMEQLTS